MLRKTIDKLIAVYFKSGNANNNLSTLERDVWQKIHARNAEKSLSWQEKMFMAFSVPEFRFASITLALMFGLAVSAVMPLTSPPKSVSQEMGLHVFASNAPYLPSTLLEGN